MPSIIKGNKSGYNIKDFECNFKCVDCKNHNKDLCLLKDRDKHKRNYELICLNCKHTFITSMDSAYKGVNCPICKSKIIANPKLKNYRLINIDIIDSKSITIYRPFFKIKRS